MNRIRGAGRELEVIDCLYDFTIKRTHTHVLGEGLRASEDGTQGLMHLQSALMINKSTPPELIHEHIDSRTGRADHRRQRAVAEIRHVVHTRSILPGEASQSQ